MNSVSEKIDERILRLLGLQYTFDLDYDTYLTLIREAMVSGAGKLPQEELALLANERKRVRGKKGRFKPKKQKITAGKFATTKFLKPTVQPVSTPLLSGSVEPQTQLVNLSPLQGPIESIKKTLSSFFDFRKDAGEQERRDYEFQKRSKREEGLEGIKKGMGAVSDAVQKFISPFQGIIDRIWRFIYFTLLGRAFTQLVNWFGDSKNKKKVEVLKRFLKDWWPSLLAAAGFFFTPFGKFVRGILSIVGGLTGRLISLIPRISGAVKGLSRVLLNPWVAVPAAAVGLAAAANEVTGQRKAAGVQAENKARAQTGKGLGVQGTDTMTDKVPSVGNMGATTPYGLLQQAARGGSVMDGYYGIDHSTGQRISGFGPDTQLIAAQPGEVVINKKTVDAVGADTFLSLNHYYGGSGANQPKFGRLFNTGGIVGGLSRGVTKLATPIERAINFAFPVGGRKPTTKGLRGAPLKRIMHGTSFGAPESIRATGFREQMGMLGKGVYGSVKGWVSDTYRGAGKFKGILPGQGPRLDMLVPQGARTLRGATVVSARQANRGLRIAEGIMSGRYTGAKARSLMPLLTRQTPSMGRVLTTSAARLGGRFVGALNAPIIGDMLDPAGTAMYDQLSGPYAYYNAPGYRGPKPLRRQGGGEISGSITPEEGMRGYQMALKKKELPDWIITELGREIWDAKYGPAARGGAALKKYYGGGLVKENTGMNIRGATADRQMTALQPGEYVLPVDTVSRLGTSLIDKLVAFTDSNSNPAKLGKKNINRPNITPLSNGGGSGVITLPPITQSTSGGSAGSRGAGSRVPPFPATSPTAIEVRSMNASIYGIVG